MTIYSAKQRLKELTDEVARRTLDGTVTHKFMDKVEAEAEKLDIEIKNHQSALKWAGSASPAEWGRANMNPGDDDNGISFKGFGPGMENRIRPTSMYEMDKEQIAALKQAAQQGTPFKVQIGSKGLEHGFMGGVRTKSAVTEGGLTPNLLPPIQQMGPGGFWGLPYELTRVANYLPNVAMPPGGGVSFFQHSQNAAEAAYTAEGATKPDLTPTIKEQYIKAAKVAGRILLTHEIVQDAGDAFAQTLAAELARSVYNAESNLLLNGTTGANGFAGVNQLTGTMTRAADIGTTDEDALDTLSKAFVDLRSDFFVPDLCLIHPGTLGAIRRLRDQNKRLQLELIQGAGAIDGTSEQETLWGVPVVQTTQQAAGTAAVLSVQSGAAVVYVREALTTFFDPYSQASSNIYQYIAETRLALATPRPGAINLVSGLPTS